MTTVERWDQVYGKKITDILCGSATPAQDLQIAVRDGLASAELAEKACRELFRLGITECAARETAYTTAHDL